MKTCVLCFRRRNALQCTIRSLSRWKGVRILQARSASTLPWDSADLCANGERPASKRSTDRATLPETSLFTGLFESSPVPKGASLLSQTRVASWLRLSRSRATRYHCLGRRQSSQRHTIRTTAYVVQAHSLAEVHACGLSSVFTADTKLDIRLDATALTHSGIQELTYAGLIQLLKRILRNDFFFQVMGEELTLRIVSRKTEGCLSEIICPEAEEIRMSGYVVRSQRRPGWLNHSSHQVFK